MNDIGSRLGREFEKLFVRHRCKLKRDASCQSCSPFFKTPLMQPRRDKKGSSPCPATTSGGACTSSSGVPDSNLGKTAFKRSGEAVRRNVRKRILLMRCPLGWGIVQRCQRNHYLMVSEDMLDKASGLSELDVADAARCKKRCSSARDRVAWRRKSRM